MNTAAVDSSTRCCKPVSVELSTSSVIVKQAEPDFVTLAVNYLPSESVTVSVVAYYSETAAAVVNAPLNMFFPATISISPNAPLQTWKIALTGASRNASYALNISITGPSAREYAIAFPRGSSFIARMPSQQPSPPRLLSAVFASDGASITAYFDSPTNRANSASPSFSCASLLEFTGNNSSACQWSPDSSSVTVTPGPLIAINVGATITLLPFKLKAPCPSGVDIGCSSWKYSSAMSVVVRAPLTPVLPMVAISAPTLIGKSSSFMLYNLWCCVNPTYALPSISKPLQF